MRPTPAPPGRAQASDPLGARAPKVLSDSLPRGAPLAPDVGATRHYRGNFL